MVYYKFSGYIGAYLDVVWCIYGKWLGQGKGGKGKDKGKGKGKGKRKGKGKDKGKGKGLFSDF